MTRWRSSNGCGFILATCLVACCFLVLNGVLVGAAYRRYAALGPDFLQHDYVAQAILFIGPLLLLFFEWWLVDWIVDRLTPTTRSKKPEKEMDRTDVGGK